MDEHTQVEPSPIGDDQKVARQIVLPKFLGTNSGLSTEHNFPGAFTFASCAELGGKRVESVVWLDVTCRERVLEHGEEIANFSRARMTLKNPSAEEADLDQYEGYLSALVGDIRKQLPFDVTHCPEGKWTEHCHLELLPTFVAFLTAKAETDGARMSGPIREKNGRVIAGDLLLNLFENGGFFRKPDFVHEALPLVASFAVG